MDSTLALYAACVVLLFVKMFMTSLYQGYYRISRLTFKNPEDARFVGREASAEELPQVRTGQLIWLNDLENIPIFFALGLVYVLVGASPGAAIWLFPIFTLARTTHTVAYVFHAQPWRTIAYAVGTFCLFGMAYLVTTAIIPTLS